MADLLSVMAEHQLESNKQVHVSQISVDTIKEKRLRFVYSWIIPFFSTFWIIVAVFVFLIGCYFCDWHILHIQHVQVFVSRHLSSSKGSITTA